MMATELRNVPKPLCAICWKETTIENNAMLQNPNIHDRKHVHGFALCQECAQKVHRYIDSISQLPPVT